MKIAIIGGYGKLGCWLARFLLGEGHEVTITGRDQKKLAEVGRQIGAGTASNTEATASSDAVVISVPIGKFEEVVQQIAPHTHAGQLILDVTSIKEMPVQVMHRYIKNGTVLGTHPMFGPGAKGIKGQKFVLTPVNKHESALAEKVRQYLEDNGAGVVTMTPAEHDHIMSIVLALSHFIALVSADTLLSLDKLQDTAKADGTTYRMLLTLAESVLSEDPDFYASLQMHLPDAAAVEELFSTRAAQWAELARRKDSRQFVQKMNHMRDEFIKRDPNFARAYKDMYRLIDRL
ncbi:MAG: prephenate dehydrogenase [Dehalococcoidia bacterium]|nr:prephenate dehydrogenase [Dehalococcoidia bacterium]MDD5493211.1 prephenate dehydrogenase [Dehalococcoidia bacterium]